jgi:hypothetical protein
MRGQSSTSLSNRSGNVLKDHQGARSLQRPQLKDIKDTKVCPGSMCRKWNHLTASLLREMAATSLGEAILCRQHPIIFRGWSKSTKQSPRLILSTLKSWEARILEYHFKVARMSSTAPNLAGSTTAGQHLERDKVITRCKSLRLADLWRPSKSLKSLFLPLPKGSWIGKS